MSLNDKFAKFTYVVFTLNNALSIHLNHVKAHRKYHSTVRTTRSEQAGNTERSIKDGRLIELIKHLFFNILFNQFMKTKFILNFAGVALTLSSFSQIKIFPGGSVSIGATTSPTSNAVMHQIIGAKTVFPASTSAITSAPMIIGQNVVSGSPAFTFHGDHTTGIAHPASSILAVTIANSEKFRFNSSNQMLSVNTTSSASTPDYSWNGDANTGMYHPSNGVLGFSVGGLKRLSITNQLLVDNNAGQATTPDYSWGQDANTGMYRPLSDVIGFTTGGTAKLFINATGQILKSNSGNSAALPDFSWDNDPNTGIYNITADVIGFSTGGTEKFRISSVGQLLSSNAPASAASPDFSWSSDSNTGIYNLSADVIGFSTNGTERMRLRNDGLAIGTIGASSDARLALYGATDKYTLQSWSNFTWDGGTNWELSVNRNATHAIMLYSTASGTTLTFKVEGAGDVWGKSWTAWSDKNLKENFDSIPDALTKLKQLKGMYYNFKTKYCTSSIPRKEMGLIAQDVEKVIPEVVNTREDGTKGIIYDDLNALYVEAIKELDKKITQLEKEINSCCSKNDQKNNRIIVPQNNDNDGSINTGSYIKQNTPNPFNKETSIDYFIAERGASSSILVFDMNGKLLKTYKLYGNGQGSLTINGNELSPGMYYYSLIVNAKEVGTNKMILTE